MAIVTFQNHPASLQRPSEGQLQAGNYAKAHRSFQGLPVTIENRRGSVRSGRDRGGHEWAVSMQHDYGYVRGTLGVDGDHFDVYLGPDDEAPTAYIVTTMAPPDFRQTDEQKAMLGFQSEEQARAAYLAHYDNPAFLGSVRAMPMAEFKAQLATTREHPRMLKAAAAGLVLFRTAHPPVE